MPSLAESKAALLSKTSRRYKSIRINDLQFRIQSLSEGERMQIEEAIAADGIEQRRLAKPIAIALCCVDEDGRKLFDIEEAKQLADVDAGYTAALWVQIAKHIGFDREDVNAIEEAEKN